MNKMVYVLLDGVGDRPNPNLNDTTPLEAAYTPNLDLLTRKGATGIVYPVGPDIPPESDIAVFSMLGYDLSSNYFGRGVVETIGVNLDFRNGDLALRANFATLDQGGIIIDRRAGRNLTQNEASELAEAINKIKLSRGAEFKFIPTISHRGVLRIRVEGKNLSSELGNTDPAYARVGGMGVAKEVKGRLTVKRSEPLIDSENAALSADLVNEFTDKAMSILETHPVNQARKTQGKKPANIILLRDAGSSLPNIQTIPDRFGIKFACILDMPVEKGVAKIVGMSEHQAGGVEDYAVKAEKTLDLLKKYDGVYIHIKGPDEPGHDGNANLKTQVIEKIDAAFFSRLVQQANLAETVFVVSADHSTPCILKGHSADPVPLLISGPKIKRDSSCRFTEHDASTGGLGAMRGVDVLPLALKYR
jgi:2,3-bisphosphoglycerate-independent phosphoglycerate mutase